MSNWSRLRRVLEDALELPAEQRRARIEQAAGDDPELVEQALRVLDSPMDEATFLEPPHASAAEMLVAQCLAAADLDMRLGPYRVERLIAAGGMGAVYEARRDDRQFEKRVAIKALAATLPTAEARRRFDRERRLLASLEHPNIARLLDAGATPDGRPYLVMELVQGVPITRYAGERALPVGDRLALFRQACEAVAHAHRALIVHRDIKPSNILVTEQGTVKLLDFGVAKLLDEAGRTDPTVTASPAPLTPRYASPEQLRAGPVTTACDVYSLGAVLYELLVGRPARKTGSAGDAAADSEPAPPSRVAPPLNRELDAIVLTAMAADPARRYRTVDDLGEDIGRYLGGEPVRAHPPSRLYKLRKALRRHRWAAAFTVAVALFLALFAAGAAWHGVRVERERRRVEEARLREAAARRTADRIGAFLTKTLVGADPALHGDEALNLLTLLKDAESRLPELEDDLAAAASVRLTLARVYATLWLIAEAGPHAHRAVELFRRIDARGPLADALQTTAEIHVWNLDYESAERAAAESLAIRRELGAPSTIADALGTLADIVDAAGRDDEAEQLLREAVTIRRSASESSPLALAEDLEVLAFKAASGGDDVAAMALSNEALELRRAAGNGPAAESEALAARADVLAALNRAGEAIAARTRALELIEEARGADHPSTIQRRLDLGYAALGVGDLEAAERYFRDTAEIAVASLPPWHRHTSHARGRLGDLLLKTGRYAEAEPHLLAAHSSLVRMLGEGNFLAAQLRHRIAHLYEQWGRADEAAVWRTVR